MKSQSRPSRARHGLSSTHDRGCSTLQPLVRQFCSVINIIADATGLSTEDAFMLIMKIGIDIASQALDEGASTHGPIKMLMATAYRHKSSIAIRAEEYETRYAMSVSAFELGKKIKDLVRRAIAKAVAGTELKLDSKAKRIAERALQFLEEEMKKGEVYSS